ncbi:hypothetical protein [Streptomyces sp. NPDC096033]
MNPMDEQFVVNNCVAAYVETEELVTNHYAADSTDTEEFVVNNCVAAYV